MNIVVVTSHADVADLVYQEAKDLRCQACQADSLDAELISLTMAAVSNIREISHSLDMRLRRLLAGWGPPRIGVFGLQPPPSCARS